MKKVVTLGGGTGNFTVLTGLKEYPVELSAIVAMSDDGGSTGRLRTELGVLPPGDIRQCLVALSSKEKLMLDLMNYRFTNGGLEGNSFGNLLLSALEKVTGSFAEAVRAASQILGVKGTIIPVTLEQTRLCARVADGRVLEGEYLIDNETPDAFKNVEPVEVYLRPSPTANPEALQALREADAVIIGPGAFYGSVLSHFFVRGIPEALRQSHAKKIFVCNLMTRWGQKGYKAQDFLDKVREHTPIDVVFVNTAAPPKALLEAYQKQGEFLVEDNLSNRGVVRGDFLRQDPVAVEKADRVKRNLIRHDAQKLAASIIRSL